MGQVRRPSIQYDARGIVRVHGLQKPEFGVWHDTESHDAQGIRDLRGVANYWANDGRGFGAHIIIDRDGNSAMCGNPTSKMWAVENHNTGAVHVELVGFASFTPKLWRLRPKQLDKLAKWMAWLNHDYKIPLQWSTTNGWAGHRAHSRRYGGSHTDPGLFFPANKVLRRARFYRAHGW